MSLPEPHEYLGAEGTREAFNELESSFPDCWNVGGRHSWAIPLKGVNILFRKDSPHSIFIDEIFITDGCGGTTLAEASDKRLHALSTKILDYRIEHLKKLLLLT